MGPDPEFTQYLQILLTQERRASAWVHDCTSAIGHVQSANPDVVISTLALRLANGLDLSSALHDASPSPPPFLLLTADHRTKIRKRALAAGVHSVLKIPFPAPGFLTIVETLVGRAGSRNDPNVSAIA